jgi:hypothetical protein
MKRTRKKHNAVIKSEGVVVAAVGGTGALEKTAIDLEVIEQLKIWASELAEIAEGMEGPSVQHEMVELMVLA